MSEVEFDRMLDAVRTAIAPAPEEDFLARRPISCEPPKAANDNLLAWPFVPIPKGWYAAPTPGWETARPGAAHSMTSPSKTPPLAPSSWLIDFAAQCVRPDLFARLDL